MMFIACSGKSVWTSGSILAICYGFRLFLFQILVQIVTICRNIEHFLVNILFRLFNQKEDYWQTNTTVLIHTIDEIDTLHIMTFGMIPMPANDFILIRIRFFLNRIINDQNTCFRLNLSLIRFDQLPQIFRCFHLPDKSLLILPNVKWHQS
jgi:hypothetical protein